MSQEQNAQIVRRFIEALISAQVNDDWQPVLAELDTDVEIDDLDISLDTERYRGYDEFLRWIADWSESWGSWRIDRVEVRPAGDGQLIALFVMHVAGRGSGIELSRQDAMVFTLREGKITGIVYYNDQQQALDAVGLAE
jgi:ketosteroid isomerase-like protein